MHMCYMIMYMYMYICVFVYIRTRVHTNAQMYTGITIFRFKSSLTLSEFHNISKNLTPQRKMYKIKREKWNWMSEGYTLMLVFTFKRIQNGIKGMAWYGPRLHLQDKNLNLQSYKLSYRLIDIYVRRSKMRIILPSFGMGVLVSVSSCPASSPPKLNYYYQGVVLCTIMPIMEIPQLV